MHKHKHKFRFVNAFQTPIGPVVYLFECTTCPYARARIKERFWGDGW